ncbi:Ankyrin repeat protein [Legionella busanensis]|uniref:Ankyrin repeat protein n=1 Tax=Legionella busanensis TaxID=190655 RepID=A0A378JM42_9GAMM|nr:ankyrin repeat domain-containing protein [Legionella busanensis]STX51811.1 Ankyrin repeat protein [Legionella busanensis]
MQFFKDKEGQPSSLPAESSPSLLDSIPTEVLWKIFSYSNPVDMTTLAQSSKYFSKLVKEADDFWQEIYHRHFPNAPEKLADKSWYDTFMERYQADYPQPEVRRLAFLIKAQDEVNLERFIKKHQGSIKDLLDIKGKETGKTPLKYAQEIGNRKILDQLFQAVDLNYRNNVKEVASSELISRAISLSCSAIENLPTECNTQAYQIIIAQSCMAYHLNHSTSALQNVKIKTSDVAIAEHHNIVVDRTALEGIARYCIEINMSTAAAKVVIAEVIDNLKNILDAINFINSSYSHEPDSLSFYNDEKLCPLIDKFRKKLENNEDRDPRGKALAKLIFAAEEAAYTSKADEQGRTIFYWAIACCQSPQALANLLKMGSSLEERYMSLGYRPLHIAASLGYNEIIQLFFTEGADPLILNTGNSIFVDYFKAGNLANYLTHRIQGYQEDNRQLEQIVESKFHCMIPIHLAAEYGHKKTVIKFIQYEPTCATTMNDARQEVMDVAVMAGQKEVVEALLQLSPQFFSRLNQESLLVYATDYNHTGLLIYLVKYLLQQRDDLAKDPQLTEPSNSALEIELTDHSYFTLHFPSEIDTIFEYYLSFVNEEEDLLGIEAFISTIYRYDPKYLNTLITNAPINFKPKIKNEIQKIRDDLSSDNVFLYVKNGDIEGLSRTLTLLSMLDQEDKQGKSLLTVASQEKNPLVLNYIYQLAIAFNSEKNILNTKKQSGEHRTILYWAIVCHQDEKVIQELLDKGSKPNEKYFTNNSQPLHIAAQHGNNKIIPLLIKAGASLTAPDIIGKLPIHVAIEYGNLEAVEQFLTQDKALLKILDFNGRTLLHLAVRYGQPKIMEFLIKQGCDLKATDSFDMQPIHLAVKEGQLEAVKCLLETSNDLLEEKDRSGKTTQELAELHGNTQLSKLISEYEDNKHSDKRQKRPG